MTINYTIDILRTIQRKDLGKEFYEALEIAIKAIRKNEDKLTKLK